MRLNGTGMVTTGTCIIGMYYNNGKGAVVISDSRIMIGSDYSHTQKLFDVGREGTVFAAAGFTGIAEKLIPNVANRIARTRQISPNEIVNLFEDEMAELHNRYKMTRPYRFGTEEELLCGIIGFLDDATPRLHCLYENGYAEAIREFHSVGHGDRHARNILRTLYTPSLSKDRALQIGVHALMEVAKIDAMVDDVPQVAVIEDGISKSGVRILNCCPDDEFRFECPEVEQIKKKLEGIEGKRTQVFHLLLDGTEDAKRKLDEVLKEYDEAKRQQGAPGAPAVGA